MWSRRLCGLTGSVLDHRSLPPEFESRRGHIWRVFHLWPCLITFGGRSVHSAYHVLLTNQSLMMLSLPSFNVTKIWHISVRIWALVGLICFHLAPIPFILGAFTSQCYHEYPRREYSFVSRQWGTHLWQSQPVLAYDVLLLNVNKMSKCFRQDNCV